MVNTLDHVSRVSYPSLSDFDITKTCPCNKQSFLALKIENFQWKIFDIFRYSLEPPRRGGSNVYPQSMF